MKKFFYDNRINFLFLIISFLFLISILGLDNVSYQNTEWLYDGDESAINQLSWFFFKNDIWRFPLGSNPNYGGELGNSIFLFKITLLEQKKKDMEQQAQKNTTKKKKYGYS